MLQKSNGMPRAELVFKAMTIMAQASAKINPYETAIIKWHDVAIYYYPMSQTRNWFTKNGVAGKRLVIERIEELLSATISSK